jgi:hypothetical protein
LLNKHKAGEAGRFPKPLVGCSNHPGATIFINGFRIFLPIPAPRKFRWGIDVGEISSVPAASK